ncbi:hypothetical protein DEU56DRAFT_911151 [Suillus clintonianus]|uniref:uncharacterized protein n=1 Tax=Suillus clintonianus TaxID=1904413 RepID=UPI001B879981|nr:uncharacterized protein DEU56DRAFT_911151 [Suillus clintonianus]KAG2142465.1 hypothetical protein DEU56DRAFT_911151 [Suillus clintonianus]
MLHSPAPIVDRLRSVTLHAHKVRYEHPPSSSTGSMTSPCGPDHPRPNSPNQNTDEIIRTIMKVRKSWKTLKGNKEPVWPPNLEATMLKGLQEYEPIRSREIRSLGRFPQRNQFISEYIHRKTGKHRSSKQIGSRLQQFRDTSEGRELIESLSRVGSSRRVSPHNHSFEDASPSPLSSDSSTGDSSSTSSSADSSIPSTQYSPAMSLSKRNHIPETRTPVYIDILPESSSFSVSSSPSLNAPRTIRDIDSTVTFVSPSAVIGKSSYIVLLDGAPIHSEDTKLECVGPYFAGSSGDGPLLYSTALVPKYWETLCKCPDPTVYTIIQDVYRAPDPGTPTTSSGRPRPVVIFSATYHFRYTSVHTHTSSMSPQLAYQANSQFPANTHTSPDLINPTGPLPFQNYPMSLNFSEEGRLQSHEHSTQNGLDEPFILDGSLDNFSLDDFMINIHDSPNTTPIETMAQSSSSGLPTDIRNYIM